MRKKRIALIVCTLFLFLLTPQQLTASSDGTLQLNQNIIMESDGGTSTSHEFPIRNELFSAKLNELAQEQMENNVIVQREKLDFSEESSNTMYQLDTNESIEKIFVAYQPTVLTSETDKTKKEINIWYWLMGLLAIPLIIGCMILGKRQAKRSVKKKNE